MTHLILIRLSQFSSLIPVLIGLIYYQNLNKPFKRLVWFLTFFAFVEFTGYLIAKLFGNNMPLLHIFTILEFAMLLSVFINYFNISVKYYLGAVFLFTIIVLLDAIGLKNLFIFGSVAKPLESIVFTIVSLYFYYKILNNNLQDKLLNQPMFWYSSAILVYFSINFFQFLLLNVIMKESINIGYLDNNIHSIINTLTNLIYTLSFVSFKWKTS
jgi:hypothetical protein